MYFQKKFPKNFLFFIDIFILQAADYLEQAEYDTGNHAEDLKAQSLMRQLLYNPKLQAACPLPFDEAKLWQGQSGPELKQQIQKQFRNIRFLSNPLFNLYLIYLFIINNATRFIRTSLLMISNIKKNIKLML